MSPKQEDNTCSSSGSWDALDRYLAGQASPEETTQIQQRWGWTGEVESTLKRLPDVYTEARGEQPPVEAMWRDTQGRIVPKVQARTSRALWYTAASGLVTFVLLLIAWTLNTRDTGHVESMAMSTYTTGNKQQATVTLPDGSHVVLNVASQLRVPVDYGRNNRTLHLNGEAVFTVVHHTGVPFTVVAGSSTTRVLGTQFRIRRYDDDTSTTVAVRDGKVSVGGTVITAMQQVDVDDHGIGPVKAMDVSSFSFASGHLVFTSVPLPSAIGDLNRWYDADIHLGDNALDTLRLTAKLTAGSIADLTAILRMTFGVRVVRDGRVLTIYSK